MSKRWVHSKDVRAGDKTARGIEERGSTKRKRRDEGGDAQRGLRGTTTPLGPPPSSNDDTSQTQPLRNPGDLDAVGVDASTAMAHAADRAALLRRDDDEVDDGSYRSVASEKVGDGRLRARCFSSA